MVEAGEENIVQRGDHPGAKIVPYPSDEHARTAGALKGQITIADDFDAIPEGFEEYLGRAPDWWTPTRCCGSSPTIRTSRRDREESNESVLLVSSASIWEMATTRSLGKLQAPDDRRPQGSALVAVSAEHPPVRLGVLAGEIEISPEFDDPLPDFASYGA